MSFELKVTADFARSLKRVSKKHGSIREDILILIKQLEQEPQTGILIRTNLYKIRLNISSSNISSSNKGKSGGARVITYVLIAKETVFLAEIYLKSESETIDEQSMIRRLEDQYYI